MVLLFSRAPSFFRSPLMPPAPPPPGGATTEAEATQEQPCTLDRYDVGFGPLDGFFEELVVHAIVEHNEDGL